MASACRLPLIGHVLIVDDDPLHRDTVAEQMERAGIPARVADTYEQGLQVFRTDKQIQLVILDHPLVGGNVTQAVEQFRTLSEHVAIVGNSGQDRSEEFAAAGVDKFLHKPWRLDDLSALLVRRIEACVHCARPLPLRCPGPGEEGESWICASCGCRYRALIDELAKSELHPYVVRG